MSYKTDFIIDYMDEKEQLTNSSNYTLNYYDVVTLDMETYHHTCIIEELENFICDIFTQHANDIYWIMVQDKTTGMTKHIKCTDIDDYISRLTYFSSQPSYTCYFIPTTFSGWRCDKDAIYTGTLFVDIDDVDVNLIIMTDAEIIDWLKTTYKVPDAFLPHYLMVSGHGVHLYFPIKELILPLQEQTRKFYTKHLINYYKGDIACLNASRIMRCPTSFNQKDDTPIKSRLITVSNMDCKDIKRLDYYISSNTDSYFSSEKERIAQKKRDTRNANHNTKSKKSLKNTPVKKNVAPSSFSYKDFIEDIIDYDAPHIRSDIQIPFYDYFYKINEADNYTNLTSMDIFHKKYPNLDFDNTFNKNNRYLNIIKDLNNYFVRRKGILPHKRDIFIHILSTVLINAHRSYLDGLDTIKNYLSPDFYDEGIQIYDNTYDLMAKGNMYHYSNIRIAELLEFTEDDYKYSFSSYNKKSQTDRKKMHDKKRCIQGTKQKKALHDYIQAHMDSPIKEIATIFNVSTRTVIRYRNKIKNATS